MRLVYYIAALVWYVLVYTGVLFYVNTLHATTPTNVGATFIAVLVGITPLALVSYFGGRSE